MHSQEGRGGLGETGDRLASTAQGAAGEVASTAGEQARSLAHEARSEARQVTEDVQERLREETREQARRASENLRQWSEELSSMAESGDPDSPVSGVVRQVAQRGRGAADFLDHRGVEGLVEETKRFARRRPVAFLAGAAVAGFAVGRLVKAASDVSSPGADEHQGRPEAIPAGEQVQPPAPRMSDAASREEASFPTHATSRPERPGPSPSDRGTPGHEF